ncbi:uncharacterized protein LOC133200619 [Saccostrea echinata]|uniref:uncharacterized protein LOC133200619 n=1 Tax=Saccostrea echinata TaxID=191078 RepID=UPI002A821F24|nr:uncharacterized protein LOC133200619 [Saccostrea echinata]
MTLKVLILGHSFIRRFENFVSISSDHRVTPNLNLNSEELQIFYLGYGGASLAQIRAQGTRYVRNLRPDVVLLQAVSNDLCRRNTSVEDIFHELADFVIYFRDAEDVKKVVVLQTLHRIPPTRRIRFHVDTEWFNKIVDELNRRMSNYLQNVEGAAFFRLSGFWCPNNQRTAFLADGVHLNNQGNKKYYNNLRAVIVSLIKSINNDE